MFILQKKTKLISNCFRVHSNGFSYMRSVIPITDSGLLPPPTIDLKCKVQQVYICVQCPLYSRIHQACEDQRGIFLTFEVDGVIQK